MNTNPLQDALRSRWTLEGRIPLAGVAEDAVWHRARTVATGENVTLFIVQGEAALEAADAVRRAYLVEDPHLLPVREIVVLDDPREEEGPSSADAPGRRGPITVVEYPMPPAPPLAALLGSTQLHPETARSIIGEAATGLETARRRGVRHQFLDSNRIFVDLSSGEVVVLGVGVEAASHVGLDRSRENASFQDTAALVALLYRTLSGKSPQHDPTGLVPRASTLVDTPIPADLDLLCDLVLNESGDDVPETTRELIAALEPWQSIPVTLEAYPVDGGSTPAAPLAAAFAAAAGPGTTTEPDAPSGSEDAEDLEQTIRTSDRPVDPGAAAEPAEGAETVPSTEPAADESSGRDGAAESGGLTEAAGAAGGAGMAGAAGIAASSGAGGPDAADATTDRGRDTAPAEGSPSADAGSPAPSADPEAPAPSTDPDASASSADPDAPAASAEPVAAAPSARIAADAQQIVQDLHLDQKRSTSPFPGRLDIEQPEAPQTDAPSDAAAVPVAAAAASAAASSPEDSASPTSPEPATGSSDSPTSQGSPDTAPLAPTAEATAVQQPVPETTDPELSAVAPTPSEAPGSGPVPVIGRTESMAAATGPIVVRGRDRSAPDETTVPAPTEYARSSLLRDVVSVAVDSDDPDTYALGPRQPEERSRQSQWIIAGALLLTIIAAVFAVTTATSGLRTRITDPLETAAAPPSPTETEEEDEAPVEPTPEDTEEPDLPAPEISGVELFSEGGGEPDHTDQQDRLTDDDPETFWSTQHYASPDFGGIKEGVGMRISFEEESTVSAVTVTTARNTGGSLELRALNDDGSLGDVLASGEFAGDGEVRLEPDEPTDAEKVALFIPELPPDSNESGRFRARIAEISLE